MRKNKNTKQLMIAAEEGNVDTLKTLLSEDDDLLRQVGDSLLLEAATAGASGKLKVDAIRYLLERGANPNAIDNSGNTALHRVTSSFSQSTMAAVMVAAVGGKCQPLLETACMLLAAGTDVTVKNGAGETCLDTLTVTSESLGSQIGALLSSAESYKAGTASKAATPMAAAAERMLHLSIECRSVLECHVKARSPEDCATQLVASSSAQGVPFLMVPDVVRQLFESLKEANPSVDVPAFVQEAQKGLSVSCPKCGPLDSELIHLFVAVKWAKQESPQAGITIYGNILPHLYHGVCPDCRGAAAELSFDFAKSALSASLDGGAPDEKAPSKSKRLIFECPECSVKLRLKAPPTRDTVRCPKCRATGISAKAYCRSEDS